MGVERKMAALLDSAMVPLMRLQSWLDFDHATSPSFTDVNSPGRHGLAGLAIGSLFGFSACVLLLGPVAGIPTPVTQWFTFTFLLSIFHAGEWYVTAAYRPRELEYKSWIINHSVPYSAVQLACAFEFWVEYLLFPSLKGNLWLIVPSVLMAAVSIAVRIVGMAQCGQNFDHIVMQKRKEGHQLVTTGIYAYLRHPSYFGFYYWSVTAQLILGNPIMTLACAVVSVKFFQGRIPPEEKVLVESYGDEYTRFCQNTPILIPFVKGHVEYMSSAARKNK